MVGRKRFSRAVVVVVVVVVVGGAGKKSLACVVALKNQLQGWSGR